MFIYSEFYNVFVNLIRGNIEAFEAWRSGLEVSTNNWLLDAINAILIRLPDIATIAFLVIVFFVICWLPILLFRLCQNLDPKYKRFRK